MSHFIYLSGLEFHEIMKRTNY